MRGTRAIVLAAGRGTRLREVWPHPKCLLPVGGTPLLGHYMDALARMGIEELIIVTGYEHERIEQYVAGREGRLATRMLHNSRYERGSVCSLHVAAPALAGPVLLMDGDVFFEEGALDFLAGTHDEALLLDPSSPPTAEAYRAEIRGDRVVRMGRGLSADPVGEWVGFARCSADRAGRLAAMARESVDHGHLDAAYEDVLSATIAEAPMPWVSTAGGGWVEIDTPEDYARAQALANGASLRAVDQGHP